jgi:hypothetical protein
MRSTFCAYGLRLVANRVVPGVIADSSELRPDVEIHFGFLPRGISGADTKRGGEHSGQNSDRARWPEAIAWTPNDGRGIRLRYDDGTVFVIDEGGSRVWAVWPESLTLEDTVTYLLGPVLAFVLSLRGITCLHASALSVDGRAVALAGPSGAGKSTTAAAFAGRGFRVLTDDLLALGEAHGKVIAHPGYPRLRLWPEASVILYGDPDALPPLTPNWDKRYLDLQSNPSKFEHQPLHLSSIYLLDECRDDSKAPSVESLTASAALLGLLANSRGHCHWDRQSRRREFGVLGRLVGCVPVKRVIGRAGSQTLPDLCDVILEDLQVGSGGMVSKGRVLCTT